MKNKANSTNHAASKLRIGSIRRTCPAACCCGGGGSGSGPKPARAATPASNSSAGPPRKRSCCSPILGGGARTALCTASSTSCVPMRWIRTAKPTAERSVMPRNASASYDRKTWMPMQAATKTTAMSIGLAVMYRVKGTAMTRENCMHRGSCCAARLRATAGPCSDSVAARSAYESTT